MKTLRHTVVAAAAALALCTGTPAWAAAAPVRPTFTTLKPGHHVLVDAPARVHVVLVGYPRSSVDPDRLLSDLPQTAVPLVREPDYGYGTTQPVGLRYRYSYDLRFAGRQFDDAFFDHLAHAGTVGAPDSIQQLYNDQQHNVLDVGPKVRSIDAASTEHWLEQHAQSQLGVPADDYTVFLVDWYSRPDFQFHVYTRTGSADPDTGYDGGIDDISHLDAWGGSSGRTWFYDASAGPVYWDDSWDVDDADLYGFGQTAYRMPPIWEYGNKSGYRPFTDLSGDLAAVIRWVAVDELFTASPLYDPAATVPGPGGGKHIELDIFEGDPTANGLDDVRPALVQAAHQYLEPYYPISVTVHDQPLAGPMLRALQIANGTAPADDCWNQYGSTFAELYCYLAAHRSDYFSSSGDDAVIPAVGFTVPDDGTGDLPFTGYTGDDWTTGAPSFIYMFDTPYFRSPAAQTAYAYTHLLTHEAGHYVGLSHTHDGYDPGKHLEYGVGGATDFAWLGDESASAMSYLEPYEVFDVLNRDNMARWQVGRLLDLANSGSAAVLAGSPDGTALADLQAADDRFAAAEAAMSQARWVDAATDAVAGYREVQLAAQESGTTLSAPAVPALSSTLDSNQVAAAHLRRGIRLAGEGPLLRRSSSHATTSP
ncbi:MAG TPA: hypothetical protein VJ872_16160 [Nocardioides sp.]|nr:hypothetical protein [Nocardioides sp.]